MVGISSSTSLKKCKSAANELNLLGGSVSVFIGDFSRNLPRQREKFIPSCQEGIVLHTELSGCFVNRELRIKIELLKLETSVFQFIDTQNISLKNRI